MRLTALPWSCRMREIVSPLDGIRSPFRRSTSGTFGGGGAAASLIGGEYDGFALDFLANGYAIRTLNADDMLGAEPSGLAIEFISNTSAMKVS